MGLHEGGNSVSFMSCFGDLKLSKDIHTIYCNKTLVLFLSVELDIKLPTFQNV